MRKPRIGILTGGGDCPGLNAVIRAVVKALECGLGMDAIGFLDGFRGLVDGRVADLRYDTVSSILTEGGTILGTSNRDNFFRIPRGGSQKAPPGPDRLPDARRTFRRLGLRGIVCVGGDGTQTVGFHLHRRGIPVVGVPKTIDNDVRHTDRTFGFDTASAFAAEAIVRLRSTAESHHRVMVVEVMGRHAGWIALESGLASGGDAILIPEIPYSFSAVCDLARRRSRKGRRYSLVVVAEGAKPRGGQVVAAASASAAHPVRLGGVGPKLAAEIEEATGLESRATVLGHLQRGGTPTPFDRVLATRFGHAAALLASKGAFGRMVRLAGWRVGSVPLSRVAGRPRTVPLDSPLLACARAVGTEFGERRP